MWFVNLNSQICGMLLIEYLKEIQLEQTFLKLTACYFKDEHYLEIVVRTGMVETSAVLL